MSLAQSLYLHFPFCESKCHYCDFYSIGRERTQASDPPRFINALKQEAKLRVGALAPKIDTIFMGGGTPSMTPARDMQDALAPLSLHSRLASDYEWTMEANPSSIHLQGMREYAAFGVNRVSMGVQAMDDEKLKWLGRVHNRDAAFKALDAIFSAGIKNVSCDLICGVPQMTTESLIASLEELTKYPIQHLSCYLLTLQKNSKLYRELPSEETQIEHLLAVHDFMTARGFEHYEISNYAKPGKRARHNMAYWTHAPYLGLGPSAHSYLGNQRIKNVGSLERYAEILLKGELPIEWTEELTSEQRELEKWMLALRLTDGFPNQWLTSSTMQSKGETLIERGMWEPHPDRPNHLRCTPRGLFMVDEILKFIV